MTMATSISEKTMTTERWDTGVTAPNEGAMRTKLFRLVLDRYFPMPKNIVDLGAGPCVFAKYARDRGHNVTAVDAREARVPEDLGSIRFVRADVRDYDLSPFDVIVCLGLFYHFDLDDQIEILRRSCGKPLILDSQVHVKELVVPGTGDWQNKIVRRDGYEGVVYPEGDNPMASIGNKVSFWHTEKSLERLFAHAGFKHLVVLDPLFQSKYGGRRMYFCP
jgi:hypothetical protein